MLIPDVLIEPVEQEPVTEMEPALMAAQGVTNLVNHVDRLEQDRAAVYCLQQATIAGTIPDCLPTEEPLF